MQDITALEILKWCEEDIENELNALADTYMLKVIRNGFFLVSPNKAHFLGCLEYARDSSIMYDIFRISRASFLELCSNLDGFLAQESSGTVWTTARIDGIPLQKLIDDVVATPEGPIIRIEGMRAFGRFYENKKRVLSPLDIYSTGDSESLEFRMQVAALKKSPE